MLFIKGRGARGWEKRGDIAMKHNRNLTDISGVLHAQNSGIVIEVCLIKPHYLCNNWI